MKYKLNLFAYEQGGEKLLRLDAVTIQASPAFLRNAAKFFIECADEIEEGGPWDHRHLKDYLKKSMSKGPDVIVAKE